GHTRNTYGLIPERSGLDAEGEIIATGRAPAAYTRAAASEVPELRCPITATTRGSAASRPASRTARSSLPESSTASSASSRPFTPPRALIWLTASSAASNIAAPRGCEKGPASPITTGPVPEEQATATAAATRGATRRSAAGRGWVPRNRFMAGTGGKVKPRSCGAQRGGAGFPRGFPDA